MIAQTMVFLLVVSLVASLAAMAGDAGLRRLRTPSRWVWLGAMGLAPVLLGIERLVAPLRSTGAAPGVLQPIVLPPIVVGEGDGPSLAALLPVIVWMGCALATTGLLLVTHRRLLRDRARWERRRVLGKDVFVSTDRGPAVAGVLQPWIVLPGWALGLPRTELSLVLLHEEEHLRARDCALLAAALALVVLMAWNPIVWWQLRRLRLAMEMDCDRRVLARDPDAGAYGRSLLTVAARASGPTLGLAAFTERGRSIRERIVAMTIRRTRGTAAFAGLLLALAVLLGAQACLVEISVPAESERQELSAEPTFTPMTRRPEILNRTEVMAAMEREYPPLLRNAGIGGTVRVHFFITEEGEVGNMMIAESSGHRALDEAALRVAEVYRFSPAMNRDRATPVWVQFGITFRIR